MQGTKSYKNVHQGLIDQCKRGDSQAQFEIYRLYYKAMYNVSLRILGNAHEAEDTMQEAFFKAFDKLNTYRNEVSFGAWLRRIVVNTSLDLLKKRKMLLMPIEEVRGLSAASSNVELADTVEHVKRAILQLPDGYRVVLTLHLIDEYDHEEIAEMLGITASTSRSQFARAKRKLAEILKFNI